MDEARGLGRVVVVLTGEEGMGNNSLTSAHAGKLIEKAKPKRCSRVLGCRSQRAVASEMEELCVY